MPQQLNPKDDPVPTVHEVGWGPGLVLTGTENLPHQDLISGLVKPRAISYTNYTIPVLIHQQHSTCDKLKMG
jgi:hypothetical protein